MTIVNGSASNLVMGDIISVSFNYGNIVPNIKLSIGDYTIAILDNDGSTIAYPYSYHVWEPYQIVEFFVISASKAIIIDNSSRKYMRRMLMWENAAPENEFADQDIKLINCSVSEFSDLEIIYAKNPAMEGIANYVSSGLVPIDISTSELSCVYRNSSGGAFKGLRYFDIDTSTYTYAVIHFYNAVSGSLAVTTSLNNSALNTCMIPYRIYGIINTMLCEDLGV